MAVKPGYSVAGYTVAAVMYSCTDCVQKTELVSVT
jgi:hypothetical protein